MTKLPSKWSAIELKDLVEEPSSITYGVLKPGPFDPNGVPLVKIQDLSAGKIDESNLHFISSRLSNEYKRTVLCGGEVLISIQGTIGRVAIVPEKMKGANISRTLAVIRPKDPRVTKWIRYALVSPQVTKEISSRVSGSTRDSLNLAELRTVSLPFAPIPDQHRIIAEIEKKFTRLEAGVAGLRRVQANLKRYRAAVLKAACEGKLVPTEAELARQEGRTYETGAQLIERILTERRQQWNGKGKYKEPAKLDTSRLLTLPGGWTLATIEQVNLADRPCAYGVLQPGEDIGGGVPFVRVGDINNGRVETEDLKRISPMIAAQYPRTKLYGGEFAITLVGAIGRTAIIPKMLAGGNVARAVGIVPLTESINAHWIEIWFRNPIKTSEMISKSHEVARKTLNLEDVRAATIAIPPIAEQERIVAEVERRLSVVEELEAIVNVCLQRASRLRQSILQRAFEGKLFDA